jgi:hypothetical protein
MVVWLGRVIFGFGVFMFVFGAVMRRVADPDEIPRSVIMALYVIGAAVMGVGFLILRKRGDM